MPTAPLAYHKVGKTPTLHHISPLYARKKRWVNGLRTKSPGFSVS